ncbi:DUF6894 family protein [Methylobacterium sp. C25]|uniref:DUF6894 family protein n=1 Tax=Methylobacterium sp. C25 TaxID=2721622 RepID=UPI003FA35A75
MPRFYFDIHDGVEIQDICGLNLPSLDDAKREALRRAAAITNDPDNLREHSAVVVTVRDGPRSVLATVRLVHQIETT